MEQNIILAVVHDQATVTSLQVAEHFGKLHKNVLRSIDNLECSDDFTRLNFEPADYKDKNGDLQPMYKLTRGGFAFLCMGFTGDKGAKWKSAYLELEAYFKRASSLAINTALHTHNKI